VLAEQAAAAPAEAVGAEILLGLKLESIYREEDGLTLTLAFEEGATLTVTSPAAAGKPALEYFVTL
jgi:hypothetical protein